MTIQQEDGKETKDWDGVCMSSTVPVKIPQEKQNPSGIFHT